MILGFPFSIVAASLLSFTVAFICIWWLIREKNNWVLDYPNSRSLHSVPVPRVGGLGLLLSVLITWIFLSAKLPISVWLGVILLIPISLLDDIRQIPVWYRLLAQSIAAVAFSFALLQEGLSWLTILPIFLSIMWMSNLYNFMDGSDGLAGGMTIIGFGCYGIIALLAGNHEFALINFSISAAAIAFVYYNFHPARIFLGDVGAIPLGFLAATLGLLGWVENLWSLWIPLLVFSPFIADSSVTIIKRFIRGEKIWQAHREHYYQRIVQTGFGHRNTAFASYLLMIMVGSCAIWANNQELVVQSQIALILSSTYLALMFIFDWYQISHAHRE